ncbi:MAG: hypothetical protein H0T84_08480 [Tatlockia sp.]|nr:hypothetical protein [Tatlockia sp.]
MLEKKDNSVQRKQKSTESNYPKDIMWKSLNQEKAGKERKNNIISTSSLPGLIFIDVHSDPVTFTILEKLVPILNQYGYTKFLAEYRKSRELDSIMTDDKNTIYFCDQIRKIANNHHLDINQLNIDNEIDFEKLTSIPEINKFILENNYSSAYFKQQLRRENGKQAEYHFLMTLKKQKIKFQPVCSENSIYAFSNSECMIEADQSIANAYINTNEPSFGTVGIAHLNGVQNIFLEKSNLTNLNFCFFHLYSTQETLMEKNKIQSTSGFPDLERKLRTEEKFFSIPVSSINVMERKEEEIIEIIINKIESILAINAIQISRSPIHQAGNAHDNLMKRITAIIGEEGKRFSYFMESLNNHLYGQALRRLCTCFTPKTEQLIVILLGYQKQLNFSIDEQGGKDQYAAIHHAAQLTDPSIFDLLVSKGANPDLVCSNGKNAKAIYDFFDHLSPVERFCGTI